MEILKILQTKFYKFVENMIFSSKVDQFISELQT